MASPQGLTETAEYLHDVLLVLQKRSMLAKNAKETQAIPVLVAANKQDVFSALPVALVRGKLEEEIGRVRVTRTKGLLDSGVGLEGGEGDADDETNWLGEYGSKAFQFGQLEECGVEVVVEGGNVRGGGEDEGRVGEWWDWIGDKL